MISIESSNCSFAGCETVIIVPERAIDEAGYIQTFSLKDSGHAKHEFHALAQMAYYQQQDDELDIREVDAPITVEVGGERTELTGGMIICREADGKIFVLVHAGQNRNKLLEAANRWCTRWIRLDI